MLTDDARALLEGCCALIIGLTTPDGLPYATRGWGFDLDGDRDRGRVLVRAVDLAPLGLVAGGAPAQPIAVTAADVHTLSSVQVKGTLTEITASEPGDADRKDRYCDGFIQAIVEVDGIRPEVAERWRPQDELVRCRLTFEEMFIQTPGPTAGSSLGRVGP